MMKLSVDEKLKKVYTECKRLLLSIIIGFETT